MSGRLFLVATPIGNLGDLTFRAVETLKQVSFILCEDTRHSRYLFETYGISTPTYSLPAFAEGERAAKYVDRLWAGEDAALVSDAGSPGISDPGEKLVQEALERKIQVVPIPGPSAVIAALGASGLPSGRFHFMGFLPRKGPERRSMLEEVSSLSATLVIYESPVRLLETLIELEAVLGDRSACVARELTKLHEEFLKGSLSHLCRHFEQVKPLGEIVVLVEGRKENVRWSLEEVQTALEEGLRHGEKLKTLSVFVAQKSGWTGQAVYRIGLSLKGSY